jgi:hypothetical protein
MKMIARKSPNLPVCDRDRFLCLRSVVLTVVALVTFSELPWFGSWRAAGSTSWSRPEAWLPHATIIVLPHQAASTFSPQTSPTATLVNNSPTMVYIRQDKLPRLKEYKYSGVDHSLMSRYVMKPFYNNVVINCFPMWMA